MTHLDIYRCDRKRCPEERPADYDLAPAPNGWLTLIDTMGKPKHFHNLACLAIWARAERAAAL